MNSDWEAVLPAGISKITSVVYRWSRRGTTREKGRALESIQYTTLPIPLDNHSYDSFVDQWPLAPSD